jgi:hypothetical protein
MNEFLISSSTILRILRCEKICTKCTRKGEICTRIVIVATVNLEVGVGWGCLMLPSFFILHLFFFLALFLFLSFIYGPKLLEGLRGGLMEFLAVGGLQPRSPHRWLRLYLQLFATNS